LEIGNWKLEIGNWKLEIGNWKLKYGKTSLIKSLLPVKIHICRGGIDA